MRSPEASASARRWATWTYADIMTAAELAAWDAEMAAAAVVAEAAAVVAAAAAVPA